MAVGATKTSGLNDPGGQAQTYPLNVWITAHDNATATAQTAAELLNPFTIASSNFHWIRVPYGAKRVYVRGRVTSNMTTVTTDAAFRVFGLDQDPNNLTRDGTTYTANTTNAQRLDSSGNWGAGSIALGLIASGNGMHKDGTDFITVTTPAIGTADAPGGYATLGSRVVGVAVGIAASIGVATIVRIEIMFAG